MRAGCLAADCGGVPATIWASSLDGKSIAESSRILVTHLTDVQADGNVYADRDKKILLKWGSYPPVVRAGRAKVSLAVGPLPLLLEPYGDLSEEDIVGQGPLIHLPYADRAGRPPRPANNPNGSRGRPGRGRRRAV